MNDIKLNENTENSLGILFVVTSKHKKIGVFKFSHQALLENNIKVKSIFNGKKPAITYD